MNSGPIIDFVLIIIAIIIWLAWVSWMKWGRWHQGHPLDHYLGNHHFCDTGDCEVVWQQGKDAYDEAVEIVDAMEGKN